MFEHACGAVPTRTDQVDPTEPTVASPEPVAAPPWSPWRAVVGFRVVSEALALVLRLPFGTRVDRSGGYWPMTIAGYALTALSVPLLAVTPFIGAAGPAVGACWCWPSGLRRRCPARPSPRCWRTPPARSVSAAASGVHKGLD